MLIFNVRNQSISRVDNFSPAEKSENYLEAVFNFKTSDWKNTTKTAVFENTKSKVIRDIILTNDKCLVPWEVLADKGTIKVSVYGVTLDGKITTDVAEFALNNTLYGGSAASEPTPDVYQQIIDMINDITVSGVTDEQIARAVEKYLAENPIDGVNEDEVKRIVDEYVTENAEKFKGKDGKDGEDGEDGFSPSAKVEQTAEGALITITDAEGTTTAIVKNGKDGADGQGGSGGNLSIAYPTETDYLQMVANGTVDMNTIYVTDKSLLDGNEVEY